MKGAREYCKYFGSGQYGKLRIETHKHARGNTFRIFIGQSENEVEVYGVISGNPGWTETYGWLHKGPWVDDFNQEYKKRKEANEAAHKIKTSDLYALLPTPNEEYEKNKEKERINRVLENY